jgi:HEAT repeat protein
VQRGTIGSKRLIVNVSHTPTATSDPDQPPRFYYVRARCADALGYVAVDAPDAVTGADTLANLRIELAFDEAEAKAKLAKALAHVALDDPGRLRHQVSPLAAYLDDENELVRYHLCTALVVVGCEHAERLTDAADAFRERLTDENPYVQGRAAEALGLLAETDATVESTPIVVELDSEDDDPSSFLSERVQFGRH